MGSIVELDEDGAALLCDDDGFTLLLPDTPDDEIVPPQQAYLCACYARAHDEDFVRMMLDWFIRHPELKTEGLH